MSLTLQLVIGAAALLAMLGGIVWRSAYVFDRDFPEQKKAEQKRVAG